MENNLRTDPEFALLMPPLSTQEREQLEANILSEKKCRDPIIVWKGVVIDGHNRYEICRKHGVGYEIKEKYFPTRDETKLWIIENQLGKRNLSSAARIALAAAKADLIKNRTINSRPVRAEKNLRKTIAEDAGVSEGTVHNYFKVIEKGSKKTAEMMLKGEISVGSARREAELIIKTVTEYPIEPTPPLEIALSQVKCIENILENLQSLLQAEDIKNTKSGAYLCLKRLQRQVNACVEKL
ncbi:MAG: hypothetical protein FWE82_01605 [Defluviitaleaceae bacterium]|nr:hypothetical protein [Defluviitaleaceae bacterium]